MPEKSECLKVQARQWALPGHAGSAMHGRALATPLLCPFGFLPLLSPSWEVLWVELWSVQL